MDDYVTLEVGGASPVWEAAEKITMWLYNGQLRYHPLRLLIFTLAVHSIPEEYSFYYNFGLHLINVLLLFLLLYKFTASEFIAFCSSVLFSVYGIFKLIESPTVMISGSGLNTFFVLITLLFLYYGLKSRLSFRRYILIILSYLSYAGLMFSYEVAFPMLATVVLGILLIQLLNNKNQNLLFYSKLCMVISPYFITLILYYWVYARAASRYPGAQIVLSLQQISIRLITYLEALLEPFYKLHVSLRKEVILGIIIYYLGVYLLFIERRTAQDPYSLYGTIRNNIYLLIFGGFWFISSIVLFLLNNTNIVMRHHFYLMTAGISIIIISLFCLMYHCLPLVLRKYYSALVWLLAFPLIVINSMCFNLNYGESQAEKTKTLYNAKKQIQQYIPNVQKIDALLLKNFLKPKSLHYYQISNMDGALLQWFNYKKHINSGDEIENLTNTNIIFKEPLSYYEHINHRDKFIASNNRTEILYYDEKLQKLLPYSEFIDFVKGINLHQTRQVMTNNEEAGRQDVLNAILKNTASSRFLTIHFKTAVDPFAFTEYAAVRINGEPVNEVYISEHTVTMDISNYNNNKYIFLFMMIDDPGNSRFTGRLKKIDFKDLAVGCKISLMKKAPSALIDYRKKYNIGDPINFKDAVPVNFENWYPAEPTHRWAQGEWGAIDITLGELVPSIRQYNILLKGFTCKNQKLSVYLNNVLLTIISNDGSQRTWTIPCDANIFKPNAVNSIKTVVPGACNTGPPDNRKLGFGFQELRIIPATFIKPDYSMGSKIEYSDETCVDYINWNDMEPGFRWVKSCLAGIKFTLSSINKDERKYAVDINVGSYGEQVVDVFLNGSKIGKILLKGLSENKIVEFPAGLLRENSINTLGFIIPGAKMTVDADSRNPGLALKSFSIYPVASYQFRNN